MAPKQDNPRMAQASGIANLRENMPACAQCIADPQESVLVLRSKFEPYEGEVSTGSLFRIGLAIDHSVNVVQNIGGSKFEHWCQPGQVFVTPSTSLVESRTSALSMIGIALDLEKPRYLNARRREALASMSGDCLYDDPLLASVVQTLWLEAQAHGASTAFFEQSIAQLVDRLSEISPRPSCGRGLSVAEFAKVNELIESRLSEDISLSEMAALVARDPSGFSRAFRQTAGTTPFQYLTARRMERAKHLLTQKRRISDVAMDVGYLNASKFSAAFLRYAGQPPSTFRTASRNGV